MTGKGLPWYRVDLSEWARQRVGFEVWGKGMGVEIVLGSGEILLSKTIFSLVYFCIDMNRYIENNLKSPSLKNKKI